MWYFKFRLMFWYGTHWVMWFKKGNDKFFFDSYGVQPPSELIAKVTNILQLQTSPTKR